MVDLVGGTAVQGLVATSAVVELEVVAESFPGLGAVLICFEVDLLIFDTAPKPFDEYVIHPRAPAVHADSNAVVVEHAGKCHAGELGALVGVEDFRCAVGVDRRG